MDLVPLHKSLMKASCLIALLIVYGNHSPNNILNLKPFFCLLHHLQIYRHLKNTRITPSFVLRTPPLYFLQNVIYNIYYACTGKNPLI
ncbi:hypothetical protein AQUCO_01100206v1 [Aquilegia coerulea]|uniref:Uncharacterized protein n=1 Tax=Aquilegia coerulea TaxID=218851 RepID=A0A2G5E628_AQUCA|nr:hypothetical protein AQUCO_01100206v1 [Aquilegia coerulea]